MDEQSQQPIAPHFCNEHYNANRDTRRNFKCNRGRTEEQLNIADRYSAISMQHTEGNWQMIRCNVRRAGKAIAYVLFFLLLLSVVSISTRGQNITRAEYFFDADPGPGNATSLTVPTPGTNVTFTANISTASLTAGFHLLALRVKEGGGPWGEFENRGFYITSATTDVLNITAAEYFIDADPGVGNGTSISVTSGANINFVVNVPTTSLLPGFHFLAIRTKDLNGKWGVFEARGFYITTTTTNVPDIIAAEYFFDNDPENGNGTFIPITPGPNVNFTIPIPSTGLPSGFHFLAIRTKTSDGKWGIFESRGFYVSGSTSDASNITAAEYFFDTDPGVGNGTAIPVTSGSTISLNLSLPATALSPGFHFLAIRTKGLDDRWGIFESRGFYVSPIAATVGNIIAAEYFIDTDPGEDNGIALTVTSPAPTIDQIFPVDLTGVTSGAHILGLRVKDSDGIWSEVERAPFDILSCTPPTAPVATGATRCGIGVVTVLASGANGAQEYHWYDDILSTTVVGTGSSFITPSLNATKNYYVSIYDPATTCESPRILATASVSVIAKPALNLNGSISFCEGNGIFLRAPSGFLNYVWSNGNTTQQILATTSGDYFVKIGNVAGCFSENSDTVSVVIIPSPAKPAIAVTGGDLCSGGAVVLSGPAGFEYIWSTGATTRDITISQAATFTLSIRNTNGCQSMPSDPITLSGGQAQAFITLVGNTLVTIPGDTYQWFRDGVAVDAATQQTFEINALDFAIYSVQVTTNGCISTSDDFIYLITNAEDNGVSFRVYPNPANETLFVELPERAEQIRIVDPLGKQWHESVAAKGLHTVNVRELPQGMYYVLIKSHDNVIVFKIQKV